MQTIYNAQGETKECEAVDAREHIASGRWFNEAPQVEEVKETEVKSANAQFSKAELLEKLEAIGAIASVQMNKAELVAMLDEFEAME